MRTTIGLAVAFLIAPVALHAQTAQLVKDVNTYRTANPSSSSPRDFFRFGSKIYFAARTSSAGEELWVTDGTAAGTSQLANINPGTASSSPSRFTLFNGMLLFNARDGRGEELWLTDGTTAGTRILADISSGGSAAPGDRVVINGKLLFAATEPVNGRELWVTDGTPAGTRFFKDLVPGAEGSSPQSFVQFGNTVYFSAGDALWKTDGTESGTVVVKTGFTALNLTVAGGRIFFVGQTLAAGYEPWVSDGTEAGTRMLADIVPGQDGSTYLSLVPLGNRVLFGAYDKTHGTELWISDGTPAGTRMVRDIYPGGGSAFNSYWAVVKDGTAYFSASSPETGLELWKTDGTEGGTQLVRDIVPGPATSYADAVTLAGDRVYFRAAADGKVSTLWITDGSAGGTRPVNTTAAVAGALTYIDGVLWFPASTPLTGIELWKSDGTDAGTTQILNLATDPAPSSNPNNLTPAGDWLYFDAWDGFLNVSTDDPASRSLWRTDGTPEGTIKVAGTVKYPPGKSAGHSLLFTRENGLWKSDGTPQGTVAASEFVSRFPSPPTVQYVFGDSIFVYAAERLYLTTLAPGAPVTPAGDDGSQFTEVAGRVVFLAPMDTAPSSTAVRISDGTVAGTATVMKRLPESTYYSDPIVSAGGQAWFIAGSKLWRTDGTFEGTTLVPGSPVGIGSLTGAGTKVFFTNKNQLWVSDGTEAGTHSLPATPSSGFGGAVMAPAGNRVIFSANSTDAGWEPWVSDGTVEGTRLLRELWPGTNGSSPSDFFGAGGIVYMSATDPDHGTELWITDGTAEGTRLGADVQPGAGSSFPQKFVRAGNRVYFTANTFATGLELWSLTLDGDPRISVEDVRLTETDSGTATARFRVTLSAPATRALTVDYATADGTATAGSDYDAASGTLTFNPGETSKTLDVTVRGDTVREGNETFSVTLGSATAFGVIDDNDRAADLGLTLDFQYFDGDTVQAHAANQGPNAATDIRVLMTKTPADVAASDGCCPTAAPDIAAGSAPVRVVAFRWFGFQQYMTVTATARERDPNPSNNRVAWTSNNNIAMDALSLTPGSQANVYVQVPFSATSLNLESSNPAVLSVPASVAVPAGQKVVSFIARGVSTGSASLRALNATGGTWGTLKVDVVSPGTKQRWPGGVLAYSSEYTHPFDQPFLLTVYTPATAPDNGRTATGTITITTNGHAAGSAPVVSSPYGMKIPYYLADLGTNAVTVSYSGDENFLPSQVTWNATATRGAVTITNTATRATLHIVVAGSPMATASGTIRVSEAGVIAPVQATLVSGTADIVLPNLSPDTHTLLIEYSGDARYAPSTQSTRLITPRRSSARH